MITTLSIIRYKTTTIPFAFLAMALHRLPLALTKDCTFWKLMGCGKNGSFDLSPDFKQWGLMAVWKDEAAFERFHKKSFVTRWWKLFAIEEWTVILKPLSSHGSWAGENPFEAPQTSNYMGPVAVLTRAKIRYRKLKEFWENVPKVAAIMQNSPGYVFSVGIGEAPF